MKRSSCTAIGVAAAAGAMISIGCSSARPSQQPPRAQSGTTATQQNQQLSQQERALVGSWRADSAPASVDGFQFASVTFAPDGTYTAEMQARGETHANTGGWRVDGDRLVLMEPRREYSIRLRGDALMINDPETNTSASMRRYSATAAAPDW